MKRKTFILSSLAFVSMSFFVGCADSSKSGNTADSKSEISVESSAIGDAKSYNGKIAYIQMDSLMRNYGMFIDMSDDFGKKQKRLENDLNQKAAGLEREIMEFQEKAQKGLLTRFQITSQEEALQKKQQDVLNYRDKVMADLAQNEQVMMTQIADAIQSYVKEYNQDMGYSMILTSSGGQPVLVADPSLDITKAILDELNKRYLAQTEQKKSKK